jgi:hypothetical protein
LKTSGYDLVEFGYEWYFSRGQSIEFE